MNDIIAERRAIVDTKYQYEYEDEYLESGCPACGDPISYCQGHGEYGDPMGFRLLMLHDNDIHTLCAPTGCDESGRDL